MTRLPRVMLLFLMALPTPPARAAADAPQPRHAPRPLARLPGPAGTDVAFSRDGKLLLTAGGDEARVWDAQTYEPVTEPLRHEGRPQIIRAALGPDGNAVMTVAVGEARLWHARDGRLLHTLRHTDKGNVTFAAFSPDASTLVTCGADHTARLWDAHTGRQVRALEQEEPVKYAAFDRAGQRLVTIAEPWFGGAPVRVTPAGVGGAQVWDVQTGQKLGRRDSDASQPVDDAPTRRPIAFTADGGAVISIHTWIAFLWDASNGRSIADVDGRQEILGWELGPASVFALSADGERLAIAGHAAAAVWDVTNGLDDKRPVAKFSIGGIDDVRFSPDGRRLLIATDTDEAGVWEIATGRQLLALTPSKPGDFLPVVTGAGGKRVTEVPAVAFSPDGRRVAAGFPSDGFTAVWQVPEPNQP